MARPKSERLMKILVVVEVLQLVCMIVGCSLFVYSLL